MVWEGVYSLLVDRSSGEGLCFNSYFDFQRLQHTWVETFTLVPSPFDYAPDYRCWCCLQIVLTCQLICLLHALLVSGLQLLMFSTLWQKCIYTGSICSCWCPVNINDSDCCCRGGVCEDVEMSDQPSAGDKLVTVYLPDNQVLLTPSDSAVFFHFKLSGYVLNVLEMLETGKSF